MKLLRLRDATIELHESGLTITRFPEHFLKPVHAIPHDTDSYRKRAWDLGYGDDVQALSRDHEIAHSLLACWLGLDRSPVQQGLALGQPSPLWRWEEGAVLGLQGFARSLRLDFLKLAKAEEERGRVEPAEDSGGGGSLPIPPVGREP